MGDLGSIPGLGRSPGEGNSDPLQYFGLENPMDKGTWQATVHGVEKSPTRLTTHSHTHTKSYCVYLHCIHFYIVNGLCSVQICSCLRKKTENAVYLLKFPTLEHTVKIYSICVIPDATNIIALFHLPASDGL